MNGTTYYLYIPRDIWIHHIGSNLTFRSYAIDADDDVADDSLNATSGLYTAATILDDDVDDPVMTAVSQDEVLYSDSDFYDIFVTGIDSSGWNVDVEYYIASPPHTQRWTMRWGQRYVDYSVQGQDDRDLLQLRLDGNGDYFVVMFPRFREERAPEFAALGTGTVVKLTGTFGTDYCFLPAEEAQATVGDVYFRGEAGSIQDRAKSVVLATGAAGEVRYGEWGISAPQAASLRVETGRLVVNLPYAQQKGGTISLRTAGQWEPPADQAGVKTTAVKGGCRLVLAPGVVAVVLERG